MCIQNIEIVVLFFAKAREIIGKQSDTLTVSSPISQKSLLKEIIANYSLQDLETQIVLAVNERFVQSDEIISLKTGDEVAIIPPLSGG